MDKELISDNAQDAGLQEGNEQPSGLVQTLLKKISDNKMYVYIGVAVIVLAIVLYYFYSKNKKETKPNNESMASVGTAKPELALPKQPTNQNDNIPGPFNPNPNEYYVMDANGNPVKVSGSFGGAQQLQPLPIPKQQPSQQEIQMLQKQMLEKQMMEQQLKQQQMMQQQMMQQQMMQQQMMQQQQNAQAGNKVKLQHPESDEQDNGSDDVDIELARIQANEDDNVAQHNLTNSELAEIHKKLEMMNNQGN